MVSLLNKHSRLIKLLSRLTVGSQNHTVAKLEICLANKIEQKSVLNINNQID
jgi:hypothetical protein